MPQDDTDRPEPTAKKSIRNTSTGDSRWPWVGIPEPIRRLFDQFPLWTYPPNDLPQRITTFRMQHALYIFTTADGAKTGAPSFNPGCLKWQAYLKFTGLEFITIPSNNHASPTGSLPFLIPPTSSSASANDPTPPVPSTKLQQWTLSRLENTDPSKSHEEPSDLRYEAYLSLLDHRIRNAWLYTLYLTPSNFASIAQPLYIHPTTTNPFVHLSLSHNLRVAAEAELLKSSPVIDVGSIYRDCESAFSALSELLGEDLYFFSVERPGLFDASVFAYSHLLLYEGMEWKERRMVEMLGGYGNLVGHRQRILDNYFPTKRS